MPIVADFYPPETSDTFAFFLEGFDAELAFDHDGQLDDCFPRRRMSRKKLLLNLRPQRRSRFLRRAPPPAAAPFAEK
jgi:hypothetical protein